MIDTADYFEKDLKSFPSDDPKWKIDYMFISRDLAVKEADIPAITVSDHCPYTAEIK
jgi:endonuclease/exonuclease/phosphatase family metal-dependent hydrolase